MGTGKWALVGVGVTILTAFSMFLVPEEWRVFVGVFGTAVGLAFILIPVALHVHSRLTPNGKSRAREAISDLLARASALRRWVQDGDQRSETAAEALRMDVVQTVRRHCGKHEVRYFNTCNSDKSAGVRVRVACYEERLTHILNRI
jgi:hypothetical protein